MRGMTKHPVHHITDTLTVAAICDRLGVTRHAVRYARTTRTFPAAWYGALKDMCDTVGIPCPLSVFSWKDAAKNIGTDAPKIQGVSK